MLEIRLQKQLPEFKLDLELVAPEESVVVLFGPSGSGKSLTLSCIAGLISPDAGHIAVGGRVLYDSARQTSLPPPARHIGLLRQDLSLFPHLSVQENIGYGLFGQPREEARRQVRELVELTGLEGLEQRKPQELSGGQQQRVALARALAIRPSLLLLDEPFSSLDTPTRIALRSEVRSLQKRYCTNTLFVTHDPAEAYLMADYLAVIDRGRVLQFDVPERVWSAPASVRVAQVIGIKNILDGMITGEGLVRIGEQELTTQVQGLVAGRAVHVCIRPERITLVRKGRQTFDLPNVLEGEFVGEENDGANVMLRFRLLGPRLRPAESFDLQIDTPRYVYERLALDGERRWTISLKPAAMHVIAE